MSSRKLSKILSMATFIALFSMIACQKQIIKKADKDAVSNSENADSSRAPVLVKNVSPEYPEQALKSGIEGVVWVKITIDTTGKVTDAIVVKDSGTDIGFEEAAIKAAYKTKWKPALEKDQPIATHVTYKVDFFIR